jgi:hypothetical protein
MYPKSIQEYIVEKIIKHNKYRDGEIEKLHKILEEFSIAKCDGCLRYINDGRLCDMCDLHYCENCYDEKVKHVNTRNLSGSNMCEKCIFRHCHFCMVEIELPFDRKCDTCNSILCETCTKRWPNCCGN